MLDVTIEPTEEDLKIKEAIRKDLMSIMDSVKAKSKFHTAMQVDINTFVIKDVVISMTGNTFMVIKGENKIYIDNLLVNVDLKKIKLHIEKLINKENAKYDKRKK
jgi:hypothetical protein